MQIPSWLFFPIYHDESLGRKWNEDKQNLAERILKSLEETGKYMEWDEEILKAVLYYNKDDNARGYLTKPE
jgi:predicted RecB family nuclease